MTTADDRTDRPAGRPLVINRVFVAPRGVVRRAWTQREPMQGWGPKGATMETDKNKHDTDNKRIREWRTDDAGGKQTKTTRHKSQ